MPFHDKKSNKKYEELLLNDICHLPAGRSVW